MPTWGYMYLATDNPHRTGEIRPVRMKKVCLYFTESGDLAKHE